MSGVAGQQRAGRSIREPPDKVVARTKPDEAEARHQPGMSRHTLRTQDAAEEVLVTVHERSQKALPSGSIATESRNGRRHLPRQHRHATVVERMRERQWRGDPLDSVVFEPEPAKDRRHDGHRVNRRADVVREAWLGEGLRPATATDPRVPLEDDNRQPGQSEQDGSRQAIRPRANDRDVIAGLRHLCTNA